MNYVDCIFAIGLLAAVVISVLALIREKPYNLDDPGDRAAKREEDWYGHLTGAGPEDSRRKQNAAARRPPR